MNKSWIAHYMNIYGGHCESDDNSFRAYDADGKLRVCVQKGGDGGWHDVSEQMGLADRHDLSPIPKDSRIYKVGKNGCIEKDELHEERAGMRDGFAKDGKVLSCEALKAEGLRFDEKQNVIGKIEKKSEPAPVVAKHQEIAKNDFKKGSKQAEA